MFALGDRSKLSKTIRDWSGISKLIEECSELVVVCGKLIQSRGERKHWSGDLVDMMHDEIADVLAAIEWVVEHAMLDRDRIKARRNEKLLKYREWHEGQNRP